MNNHYSNQNEISTARDITAQVNQQASARIMALVVGSLTIFTLAMIGLMFLPMTFTTYLAVGFGFISALGLFLVYQIEKIMAFARTSADNHIANLYK